MSARSQAALATLLIAAAFAFLAWRSWRTWMDILVDFGHELYIPWRLAEGEVLYRDIPFTMGPLSQYLNALLFRLFGVSLDTLIGANLSILAAITAMLFWLFRRCGTLWSATWVTLFFLIVFAFAQYSLIGNYNYICPYRHEITHGIALGLAELVCLVRFAESRRPAWLMAAGLCLGLVGLTKLELLLPAAATAIIAIVIVAAPRRDDTGAENSVGSKASHGKSHLDLREIVRLKIWLGAAAALPIAAAVVALAIPLGWNEACAGVFANWRHSLDPALTRDAAFYRAVSGIDRLEENATTILFAATMIAIGLAVAFVIDRLLGRWMRWRIAAIFLGIAAGYVAAFCVAPGDWSLLPAPLPLLLPIVIGVSAWQILRNRSAARSTLPVCLLSVYALALLPKILLHVRWSHYGFALAMPGTLLLVHLVLHTIPAWLHEHRGSGTAFRAVWAGVLALCVLVQYRGWDRIDRLKTQTVGAGGDRFYTDPHYDNRTLPTVRSLAYLQNAMRPDDTLCVIPEGTTLNYLLRKRNPTGFLMMNPWEFDVHGGESRVLESIARSAPNYIVFVTMDMTDHGRGNFGDPRFGASIREFIAKEYEVVDSSKRADPRGGPEFQAVVLQRRASTD